MTTNLREMIILQRELAIKAQLLRALINAGGDSNWNIYAEHYEVDRFITNLACNNISLTATYEGEEDS